TCPEKTLADLIAANDRTGIRDWAAPKTIAEINAEVAALDAAQRDQLASVILDSNADAASRDLLLRTMRAVLAKPDLGFYAEIWVEATYGTKLYYRDIAGNPDFPLEAPAAPSGKLIEVYQRLSALDPSQLPWNSTERLVTCFDRYWAGLDRNVDFFAVWLPSVAQATAQMLADPDCRPV